ncbi:immunoglobulin kappa light chain-like [Clinocottus analis]|uniref:immunoglobulin kappa light chain-like n=1 Tax=Clinocottus analis TaxID=304258 RepID=UPI0035C2202E
MTSPRITCVVTWLCLCKMAHATDLKLSAPVVQEGSFLSADVGDKITLRCFYSNNEPAWLYWYKQMLGEKPMLIATVYVYDTKATFYNEFRNNSRFKLESEKGKNHLTVFDVHISDAATYYCGSSTTFVLTFAEGIVVSVKGSGLKVPALVHQSASESIQPGGSVTLNCTVHTGTCDGPHSVYWFKDSEESLPGLIYTHGGRNHQCERKPSTQTHTCVYNLPMKSLDLSHAGTYYCAVASCGHILFGDGTTLDFKDEDSLVSYLSSAALTFTSILSVLLALSVCVMNKGNSCQNTESQARCPAPSTANAKGHQQAEILYYAALSVRLHNGSRRQKDQTWSECVYHSVKQ